jgi:NADP-dependent 3-hydroxy acid dehydrogenase YdfG
LDKVVLITGCSSGIGLETAIACAKEGNTVFATVRNMNTSTELKKRIENEQLKNIEMLELDVAKTESIEVTISTIVQKAEKIDVLFNNAGFMIMGSLEDLTRDEIESQINTDLLGAIYLTKNVIPHMKKSNPGLIINMSSIAGRVGWGLSTAYCVSKFGIEGFTDSLRRELMTRNINVCLIEPGIVHSKFFENIKYAKAAEKSEYAKETAEFSGMIDAMKNLEGWTKPSDVAKEVLKIIEENGKKVRYAIGSDAKAILEVVHMSRDSSQAMDEALAKIMKEYFPDL